MKLPNAASAIVQIEKLRDYCLDPNHPKGKHKAKVFAALLGIGQQDADWLRGQILAAAQREEATATDKDDFGQRYVLDFKCVRQTRTAVIRTAWIVKTGETEPRLVTCYVP